MLKLPSTIGFDD